MKQVSMHAYGQAEVLQLEEAPVPSPAEDEVLVRVAAIGINYSDILRRRNTYFMPTPLPFTPGTEAVGTVVSAGKAVPDSMGVGSRVLAVLPMGGAYAEYVCAPAQYCIPLPPTIDNATATAIFVQGSTAQLMLSTLAGPLEGKTILVTAAAGGVGSLLVQLAARAGARVIAGTGTVAKKETVLALGAHAHVCYGQPGWHNQVKELTDGQGVDLLLEMVGGAVYNEGLESVAQGGKIIVYGCASGVQGSIHPEYFVDRNLTQCGFNLAWHIQHQPAQWQAALGTVIGLLAAQQLQVLTTHTFALHEAAAAHRLIEQRASTGKVILIP